MIDVRIATARIDVGLEIAAAAVPGVGAMATFGGIVRADDGVTALELEHYPVMTEAVMAELATDAAARWSLSGVRIVHRVGRMAPGETVVLVVTVAAHRHAALDACAYLIDALKSRAPFWKREWRGTAGDWVGARVGDERAMSRWD